ncbi:MAG TPA: hypothetical protein VLG10_01290 [Methylomirabilota bacterium]|nr:hypothetical protein [Methylomirabilota bacterium]
MTNALIAAGLVALLAGGVAPAWAEHGELSGSVEFNINLRVDRDAFRLGGQLLGLGQAYGVWLNGAVRPDRLRLDGQFQEGERSLNFKLDAEIRRWLLDAPGRGSI